MSLSRWLGRRILLSAMHRRPQAGGARASEKFVGGYAPFGRALIDVQRQVVQPPIPRRSCSLHTCDSGRPVPESFAPRQYVLSLQVVVRLLTDSQIGNELGTWEPCVVLGASRVEVL